MVTLTTFNSDGTLIDEGLGFIASSIANANQTPVNPTTTAYYITNNGSADVQGSGFTYDNNGHLAGGTITSIEAGYVNQGSDTYTNLSLAVPYAISLSGIAGGAAPVILAGDDYVIVNSGSVNGYGGNDTFEFFSPGVAIGTGPKPTTTTINGGSGVNTTIFHYSTRGVVTLSGGGGNESVAQSGITANLVSIDKLQFIDGSTYEDNATSGARAVLAFEGIYGRAPDAINAGGYGQIAEHSDTQTAARAMLATQEGQADTASLSNGDFVARLYQNILHRAPDTVGAAGWQANLDNGQLDRGTVVAAFTSSIESQQVNFAAFASGAVFAADPNAVETLRAYEILLNRLPEQGALSNASFTLDNGSITLQQLYMSIQGSAEFKADAATGQGNPYGLTASSSFAAIHAVAISDQVTSLITPLVTSNGVAIHS